MVEDRFFPPHAGLMLGDLASQIGCEVVDPVHSDRLARSVAPVYRAKKGEIAYMLSRKNRAELETSEATAIICDAELAKIIPPHIAVLLTRSPHTAFALAGAILHPKAMRPQPNLTPGGIYPSAVIDPTARIEAGVEIEPLAVIGAHAEIGSGTRIGVGALIGPGVRIGRNCTISANASVLSSFVGDNVIIHPGARIGQDGFGYAPGPNGGMIKIVQIGRVILQDHVEIGANTTIDRGTMDDTVIGEGTKIDNLVQIGHNVRIGRYCGIVAKVGIAGSTRIGDGVMIGGAAAINGHITIGDRAQIAAMSGVAADVPAGERYGGIPARPMHDFLRDVAEISARATNRKKNQEATLSEDLKTVLGTADILEIMKLLPHRYPFLLVDKIVEIDEDKSAVGIKNVTVSEPHFAGHFPEQPIMPGVLIIEGMAQTAGAICARKVGAGSNLVYFMTIDNARFRKPVVPGDRLEYHVSKQKQRGNIWKFHCDAKVDGQLVAEADIGAMIVSKEPSAS